MLTQVQEITARSKVHCSTASLCDKTDACLIYDNTNYGHCVRLMGP